EAVGSTGLEIRVFDQDSDVGSGELIGMVRLSAQDIAAAAAKTPPLLTLQDSQLKRLEVAVVPYERPASLPPQDFDVRQSATATRQRARAGELVRIVATGNYSVASNGEEITPRGYGNGEKQS